MKYEKVRLIDDCLRKTKNRTHNNVYDVHCQQKPETPHAQTVTTP